MSRLKIFDANALGHRYEQLLAESIKAALPNAAAQLHKDLTFLRLLTEEGLSSAQCDRVCEAYFTRSTTLHLEGPLAKWPNKLWAHLPLQHFIWSEVDDNSLPPGFDASVLISLAEVTLPFTARREFVRAKMTDMGIRSELHDDVIAIMTAARQRGETHAVSLNERLCTSEMLGKLATLAKYLGRFRTFDFNHALNLLTEFPTDFILALNAHCGTETILILWEPHFALPDSIPGLTDMLRVFQYDTSIVEYSTNAERTITYLSDRTRFSFHIFKEQGLKKRLEKLLRFFLVDEFEVVSESINVVDNLVTLLQTNEATLLERFLQRVSEVTQYDQLQPNPAFKKSIAKLLKLIADTNNVELCGDICRQLYAYGETCGDAMRMGINKAYELYLEKTSLTQDSTNEDRVRLGYTFYKRHIVTECAREAVRQYERTAPKSKLNSAGRYEEPVEVELYYLANLKDILGLTLLCADMKFLSIAEEVTTKTGKPEENVRKKLNHDIEHGNYDFAHFLSTWPPIAEHLNLVPRLLASQKNIEAQRTAQYDLILLRHSILSLLLKDNGEKEQQELTCLTIELLRMVNFIDEHDIGAYQPSKTVTSSDKDVGITVKKGWEENMKIACDIIDQLWERLALRRLHTSYTKMSTLQAKETPKELIASIDKQYDAYCEELHLSSKSLLQQCSASLILGEIGSEIAKIVEQANAQ